MDRNGLSRPLHDKFAELEDVLFVLQQRNRPMAPIHTTLYGVLDAMEDMYISGTLDIPLVDEETRHFRDLTEELSDLTIRKHEILQTIREGRPSPGSYNHLRIIRAQIAQVKAELNPLAMPMLPFVTEDEVEYEEWYD